MIDWLKSIKANRAAEQARKAEAQRVMIEERRTLNAAGICARCKKRPVSDLADLQIGTVYGFAYCDPCWDYIGAMSMC